MKQTTRLTAAALSGALLLSLAACGGAPANTTSGPAADTTAAADTPMGRWVETEIDLQGRSTISMPTLLADGTLRLYTQDDTGTYELTSTDNGATWTEMGTGWEALDDGTPNRAMVGPDGSTLAITLQREQNLQSFWLVAPGQAARALPVAETLGSDPMYSGPLLADGSILFQTAAPEAESSYTMATRLWRYDPATDTAADLGTPSVGWQSCPVGESLYYATYSENGVELMCLDTATGRTEVVLSPLPDATSNALAADSEGNLYYASNTGIYRLAAGGTLPELILDGEGTALSISTNYPSGLCRTAAGDFLVVLMPDSGSNYTLHRYHYDETLPTYAETTLQVWALEDNATVRCAIAAYKKVAPDVDVKLNIALPDSAAHALHRDDEDVAARRDALTALNTELLAGAGPDILILDGTDYQTYAAKGLLADLSGAVNTADLQQNIIAPFVAADGTLPVVPARFSVPVLLGDAGTLDEVATLDGLQATLLALAPRADSDASSDDYYTPLPADQQYAISLMWPGDAIDFVLETSAAAILHDNTVDDAALTQAMGFVAAAARHYGMADYRSPNELVANGNTQGGDGMDSVSMTDNVEEYLNTHARYGWTTMLTPELANCVTRCADRLDPNAEEYPSQLILRPGVAQGAYTPLVLAGVNANSTRLEQARAFVQTLLGPEVQSTFCSDGMPVRAISLRESLARAAANANEYATTDTAALLESCTTPVTVPEELRTSFFTHAEALVSGTEDTPAAVAGVKQDLQLYLAERG